MRYLIRVVGLCVLTLTTAAPAMAQLTTVTVGDDGASANASSYGPSISADGRFVAFRSYASNLVAGDTNGLSDAFVRDVQLSVTTRVSVWSGGAQMQGGGFGGFGGVDEVAISGNGRYVAFTTSLPLTSEDTDCGYECQDVYLHDRDTRETTLISRAVNGLPGNARSTSPVVSADGRYVAFTSWATNLVAGDSNVRSDVFLRDRVANTTVRVSVDDGGGQLGGDSSSPQLNGDGSVVTFFTIFPNRSVNYGDCSLPAYAPSCTATTVVDRAAGTRRDLVRGSFAFIMQVSESGRYLVLGVPTSNNGSGWTEYSRYDRTLDRYTSIGPSDLLRPVSLRGDGGVAVLASRANNASKILLTDLARQQSTDLLGGQATWSVEPRLAGNGSRVVFIRESWNDPQPGGPNRILVMSLDSDSDGISDAWESTFGLDPMDPADASGDLDADGQTNLQEFIAGTHPNGRFTSYLAEGSSNLAFSTQIAILNPHATPAAVLLRLPRAPGMESLTLTRRIPPRTRITINPQLETERLFYGDFSTIIDADQPVVVDRTMRLLNSTGHGSHAETAIAQLRTTWYFAEGATGGPFSLFYLFENPGDVAADVTVRYLRPAPAPPIVRTYTVQPRSRRTIYVDEEDAALAATNISARITSTQPIAAERSMYLASLGQPLGAATAGAAVAAPALRWFLAEGATGSFFDTYVLIVNPESTDADVRLTYLLPDGTNFTKAYSVPAESRATIHVDGEDARLAATSVSVVAESVNAVPIIVERAMWWPDGNWYEGHLAAGATTTSRKWALAEGEVGGFPPVEATYILIANTSTTAGTARVTLMFEDGASAERVLTLEPNSRTTVSAAASFPTAIGRRFGAVVESETLDLVVERAMYSNSNGLLWTAGTAALATPLP